MRLLALAAVLLAACNPKLDPIGTRRQPITASPLAPRVTWVIDKSGSMLTNVSTTPPCPDSIGGCGPGQPCPANCPTRMSLLRDAIASLDGRVDGATHNYVPFPKDAACGPASDLVVAGGTFTELETALAATEPSGGTPTAATLRYVQSQLTSQVGLAHLVVLVTDGVPNCNQENVNTCADMAACQCTTSACTMTNGLCTLGCLDGLNTVNAANDFYNAGIDLMIAPTGTDTVQAAALDLFNQMKSAVVRTCASDSDCRPGTTCDRSTGVCSDNHWTFNSAAEFAPAADRIVKEVQERLRCNWSLAAPETPDRLEVSLGGTKLASDQWELRTPSVLRFKAAACQQLQSDVTLTPSVIEL